jgi:cytohesin
MTNELLRKSIKLRNLKARKDAILKFNTKPKNAIKYLQEFAGTECASEDFAQWIYEYIDSLSKKKLGEFLGGNDPYARATFTAFLAFHDFANLSLSDALRQLLLTFRLPGEAQVIDRILEAFATRFATCNPNAFRSEDCAYVLAFSIIMLNTDLHSNNIPDYKKMKLEEFIRNNRGIDMGQDPPREMLEAIYDDIKKKEILMKESDMFESDVVTFVAPSKAGWLEKRGKGNFANWKKHWFVLADSCLYYFLKPTDDDTLPRCIIPLDNTRVGRGAGELEVKLTSATGSAMKSCKNIGDGVPMEMGTRKEFILRAETVEEREEWVRLLQANADRTPVQKKMMTKIALAKQKAEEEDRAPPIDLPPPKAEGWMKKRGENNTSWQMRYFCVFETEENTMLYYFGSKEMAQRMIDLGEETHKGCLDLREVVKMAVKKDRRDVVVDLHTSTRTWHFSTSEKEVLAYWIEIFTVCCPKINEDARGSLTDEAVEEAQKAALGKQYKAHREASDRHYSL